MPQDMPPSREDHPLVEVRDQHSATEITDMTDTTQWPWDSDPAPAGPTGPAGPGEEVGPRQVQPRPWRRRPRVRSVVLAMAAFGAGVSANAFVFEVGHSDHSTKVVIGQQVIRPSPTSHNRNDPRTSSTTTPNAALTWDPAVIIDAGYAPQSISCPQTTFCVVVDNGGRVVLDQNFTWSSPRDIDGNIEINSVSCPTTGFCAAVDQAGNAFTYNGSSWTKPEAVDKTNAPELTSVSCATPSFCVAVDGAGNALTYNGATWSQPEPVDTAGWGPASRDVASVSCPAANFCVGVDPDDSAFYFTGAGWVSPQPMRPVASPLTSSTYYKNAVACSAPIQCLSTQNLGQIAAYDGTQWSNPVDVDPGTYVTSISCPVASFCAAVDGLLPEGFNGGSSAGNLFIYDGTSWSAARTIDGGGSLQAVACPNRSFCVAVDQAGAAIIGTSPG